MFTGERGDAGNWRSRLEVTKDNITIDGKILEDKLLRTEDIWVLQNAMCSHTWRLDNAMM